MKPFCKTLIRVTVFSIAMGYLETSVVIYLRQLYYPHGFEFPLALLSAKNAWIELLGEAATLIMLLGMAMVAGRSASQRFAWFIYSFGIWDIFYYLFLKVLLNWPAGLLTWDILFLIPVPWVAPVLAPCIVSLTMIFTAGIMLSYEGKGIAARMNAKERWLFLTGSVVIVVSFCRDFLRYATSLTQEAVQHYMPQHFNWWLFFAGEAAVIAGIIILWKRLQRIGR